MLSARRFGRDTDLWVFPVGLGAGQLETAPDVDRLLGAAIDLGVNVIDSARSYGASEELLGRHLAGRRERVILSTKIGYGIAGVPDWTAPCITAGVDEALARLRTDRIDLVHLHSCPREVLERGEVVEALLAARRAGKVRVAAYSGDGAALEYAIDCGAFDAIQCSLGICDQAAMRRPFPERLGVLAKRPLASPYDRATPYAERWRAMALDLEPIESSIRFAAWSTGAHAILVGTRSPEHLRAAIDFAARGPLDDAVIARIRAAFSPAWPGWI